MFFVGGNHKKRNERFDASYKPRQWSDENVACSRLWANTAKSTLPRCWNGFTRSLACPTTCLATPTTFSNNWGTEFFCASKWFWWCNEIGLLHCFVDRLANALQPNSIRRIQESKMAFKCMENINCFLDAARKFGVPNEELFQTVDLWEKQNLNAVVICLQALGRKVRHDSQKCGLHPTTHSSRVHP